MLPRQEVMLRWVLLALVLGIFASASDEEEREKFLSRGWGDNINWVETYKEGLTEMVRSGKPLMVIHHQDNCRYSQALKKAFAAAETIQKMAQEDFIMLNLVEETADKNMAPDGYYVPRILFVDPSRTVRTDITGKYMNHAYAYEPADMAHLYQNMKLAKDLIQTPETPTDRHEL